MKSKKEGHFAQVCKDIAKKGLQVDTVEQENSFDEDCQGKGEDVHTYFGSVELGTASDSRKRNKRLITLKIAGRDVRIKVDTGAEATVIPHNLYTQITKKPPQKIHQQRNTYTQRAPYLFRLCTKNENSMCCTLLCKATSHHCWFVMPAWIRK